MAEQNDQDKTEAPTDKRRTESRSEGNVAKSMEINSVLVLLVSVLYLRIFGQTMVDQIAGEIRYYCDLIGNPPSDIGSIALLFRHSLWTLALTTLPISLVIMAVGILANYFQVGLLFTWKPLTPKLSKIDPIAGFKRLFSMRSIVETIKSAVKIIIIGFVSYTVIRNEFDSFLILANTSVEAIWAFTLAVSYKVIMWIIILLILMAILDYLYQKWEHEKNLKMTREEVKEERKQMEGDPEVKGRIKRLQREMARRRMFKEVPKATVVVTNPTYIAIAIRYEHDEMETPKVLAKGKRLMAERIKQVAKECNIPIIEDKPLARAMYDKVEPGDDIPVEFFTAVAEILAYVYRLKNRMAA
jgi:flagellar biosynthetic protein FlhB